MVTGLFIFGFPLCMIVSCFIYFPYCHQLKIRNVQLPFLRHLVLFLCCSYILLVIGVTLLLGFEWFPEARHYNLRVLVWLSSPTTMRSVRVMRQLLYNVLMFVPLGILFSLVFPPLRRWFSLLPTILLTTLSIEFIQYFTGRSADIDDVLMNFLGGFIGFLLYFISDHLFSRYLFWKRMKGIVYN